MKIVADAHIPYIKTYFADRGELVLLPGRTIDAAAVRDADILLVRSITQVDARLLTDSTVRFVGSVTAGADHLDVTWLNQAGIAYQTASGFNAPPVADYVLSVIAALAPPALLAKPHKRAGVMGVGNIGKLVVARLEQLGFEVVTYDPLRALAESDFISTPLAQWEDLDVISLHVPLTKSGPFATFHSIDQVFLQRQKTDCILINTARGAVIDPQALKQYGAHLQWCFDVWEHEPHIDKAVLAQALIATPHIAGYSLQSANRGIAMIDDAVCRHMQWEPKKNKQALAPSQMLMMNQEATWRESILAIFNPLQVTQEMRALLLSAEQSGALFDEMRHRFKQRCEFVFTNISMGEYDSRTITRRN